MLKVWMKKDKEIMYRKFSCSYFNTTGMEVMISRKNNFPIETLRHLNTDQFKWNFWQLWVGAPHVLKTDLFH